MFVKSLPHDLCSPPACQNECIVAVQTNISTYLEELSRVFFKKENIRNKYQWWLSTFYSFCIHSFVKKLLVYISTHSLQEGCEKYLQDPINLFIANSGKYDPLKMDWEGVETNPIFVISERSQDHPNDYKEAQLAVGSSKWEAEGISGSAEYLRKLFED